MGSTVRAVRPAADRIRAALLRIEEAEVELARLRVRALGDLIAALAEQLTELKPPPATIAEAQGVNLLTAARVAEILRVSERQVRRLLDSGELPSLRIRGCRRVEPAELDRYVRERARLGEGG